MDLVRIGDKLISRSKIQRALDQILELRVQGLPQQEVAHRLGIDRSFISRLEGLGEVRRGNRIAVVGFPVANKEEVLRVLEEEGVEYSLILTDAERWQFAQGKSGQQLVNELMEIIARLRTYDVVIIIGSNYRIQLSDALLGREVIGMEIGTSPITEDKVVDVGELRRLVRSIKREKGEQL